MRKFVGAAAIAFGFAVSPAHAVTVGTPVKSLAEPNVQVGSVNSNPADAIRDGTISFYIPLTDDEIYGRRYSSNHYGGLKEDTCSRNCDGGSLEMFLRYETDQVGSHLVTLDFTDLDLIGANDPKGFFESVEFFERSAGSWSSRGKITDIDQAAFYQPDQQVIQYLVDVMSDSFIAKILLRTEDNKIKNSINTKEFLYTTIEAQVSPVPLPAALPFFACALGLAGFFGYRRKRNAGTA